MLEVKRQTLLDSKPILQIVNSCLITVLHHTLPHFTVLTVPDSTLQGRIVLYWSFQYLAAPCYAAPGSIGQTNWAILFFSLFLNVFYDIFGAYIIPKWLINDS